MSCSKLMTCCSHKMLSKNFSSICINKITVQPSMVNSQIASQLNFAKSLLIHGQKTAFIASMKLLCAGCYSDSGSL